MPLIFLILAIASLVLGCWVAFKKDTIQGHFLAIGVFFLLGGISVEYSGNPSDAQGGWGFITTGIGVIFLTLIWWNFIDKVTQRGQYKVNKD